MMKNVRAGSALLLLTGALGLLSLAGWLTGQLAWASLAPVFIPMAPATALLLLVLCSTALVPGRGAPRWLTVAGGSVVVLGGAATLMQESMAIPLPTFAGLLGWQAEAMPGGAPTGQMSVLTAALFVLSGVALLRGNVSLLARRLLQLVALAAIVLLLGYLFGAPLLYGGTEVPVALPTALAFLCFALGCLHGPFAAAVSDGFADEMRRRFLPPVLLIMLAMFWLDERLTMHQPQAHALLAALILLAGAAALALVIGLVARRYGRALHQAEAAQQAAMQQLQASEQQLRANNQQLQASEQQLRALLQQVQTTEQRLQEEAEEREALLDRLIDTQRSYDLAEELAVVGHFRRDMDAEVAEWSDNCYALFGVRAGDFVPTRAAVAALVHPDDRALFTAAYARTLQDGASELQFRVQRPADGSVRLFHALLRRDARRQQRLHGIIRDVTVETAAVSQRHLLTRALLLFNRVHDDASLQAALAELRQELGCDALGVRVRLGTDYPYVAAAGFTQQFLAAAAGICRNAADGSCRHACLCGATITGLTDSYPGCFRDGVFAHSDLPALAATLAPGQRHDVCLAAGYQSMVLAPLRTAEETCGLLHAAWQAAGQADAATMTLLTLVAEALTITVQRLESEQRYRQLFANMSEGFALHRIICDADGCPVDYAFVELNPAFTRITGIDSAAIGRRVTELLPGIADDPADWIGTYGRIAQGGGARQFTQFSRPMGRWYDVSAFSPAPEHFAVLISDVTGRKRHEQQAAAQRELLEQVTGNAGVLLAWVDRDERYRFVNDEYVRVIGKQRVAVIGKTVREVHGDTAYAHFRPYIQRALAGENSLREGPLRTANGTTIEVAARITPHPHSEGFHLAVLDVSRLRETQAVLHEREAQLRLLFDTMAQGVVYQDADGRVIAANAAAERIFGLTFDQMRGRTSHDPRWHVIREDGSAYPGETHPTMVALRTGQEVRDALMGVFNVDEERHRWILVSAVPLFRSGETRPYQVYATLTDITEQRDRQQLAVRQERTAAIGQLAAGLAHNYNNLFGGLLNYLTLLDTTERSSPKWETYATGIRQIIRRGADLSGAMLKFARGSAHTRQALDLAAEVTSLRGIIDSTFPKNITVQFTLPAQPVMVTGPGAEVQQLLLNLCLNARDAMPGGGTLTVTLAGAAPLPATAPAMLDRTAAYCRLGIGDTGGGIAPAVLPHIFEPFYTTKGPQRGTGLGLSTAYATVRDMGGHIAVTSTVDLGTEFDIFLPLGVPEQAPSPAAARNGSGGSVLLIDDDRDILLPLTMLLQQRGYRVQAEADPQQALQTFRAAPAAYDIVVTDMMMPDIDGPALLAEIARVRPGQPVIIMSGYPVAADDGGAGCRVIARLAKPFDSEELLRVLDTLRPVAG